MIIDNPNKIICGFFMVSMIFIMIGHIYRDQLQSVLKKKLLHVESFDIDWWSVTHLLLYSVIGFVKPGYTCTFFGLGILFEVFEDALASDTTTKLVKCNNITKRGIAGKIMCNGFNDGYWYGKFDDIFANLLGYVIGQSIRTTFFYGN